MNSVIQSKASVPAFLIACALACFGLLPQTQAVNPPLTPDPGPKPISNTADGQNALLSITTGIHNTAIGFDSLLSNIDANFNTGVGSATLLLNNGTENTAVGAGALLSNTTGLNNTANGAFALFSNTEGASNTATGATALFSNTTGNNNTATGFFALHNNTTGNGNTATGWHALPLNTEGLVNTATGLGALLSNTEGNSNTATGGFALEFNITGDFNTATGGGALANNTTGSQNTAIGYFALQNNTTGSDNIALGSGAGGAVTAASNVICIGTDVGGANVNDSCFIGNIFDATSVFGSAVFVSANNKLGTITSSKRFKEDIKRMDKASEELFSLKPVTFRYKKEIDPVGTSHFGLVAEEVEKLNPNLVVRDKEGKPYSVRYDQVNAMLLNEFLKEHRKLEQQEAIVRQLEKDFRTTVAQLTARLEGQEAQLQKVSALIEMSKGTPNVVLNNP